MVKSPKGQKHWLETFNRTTMEQLIYSGVYSPVDSSRLSLLLYWWNRSVDVLLLWYLAIIVVFGNMDHAILDREDLPPDDKVTVSPTYLMISSGACVRTTGGGKKRGISTKLFISWSEQNTITTGNYHDCKWGAVSNKMKRGVKR